MGCLCDGLFYCEALHIGGRCNERENPPLLPFYILILINTVLIPRSPSTVLRTLIRYNVGII